MRPPHSCTHIKFFEDLRTWHLFQILSNKPKHLKKQQLLNNIKPEFYGTFFLGRGYWQLACGLTKTCHKRSICKSSCRLSVTQFADWLVSVTLPWYLSGAKVRVSRHFYILLDGGLCHTTGRERRLPCKSDGKDLRKFVLWAWHPTLRGSGGAKSFSDKQLSSFYQLKSTSTAQTVIVFVLNTKWNIQTVRTFAPVTITITWSQRYWASEN